VLREAVSKHRPLEIGSLLPSIGVLLEWRDGDLNGVPQEKHVAKPSEGDELPWLDAIASSVLYSVAAVEIAKAEIRSGQLDHRMKLRHERMRDAAIICCASSQTRWKNVEDLLAVDRAVPRMETEANPKTHGV
jgi:hypothetical protein